MCLYEVSFSRSGPQNKKEQKMLHHGLSVQPSFVSTPTLQPNHELEGRVQNLMSFMQSNMCGQNNPQNDIGKP